MRPPPLRTRPSLQATLLLCGLVAGFPAATTAAGGPTGSAAAPALAAPQKPEVPTPADPVAVHIAGIRMVGPDQVLLFLADETEKRAVPIVVGKDQGLAIYMGKEHAAPPRPMTHDLLVQMLKTLKAAVEKVTVTKLKNDTYYSEIALRAGGTLHRFDARPSDAIALAVRLDAPMFAVPALLRPVDQPEEPGVTARLRP
jgi:hypothetical protein